MNPLELLVEDVKKNLHPNKSNKDSMIHFDFFNVKEVAASFSKTYVMEVSCFTSKDKKIFENRFDIGYAPSGITPCKTRLISHMVGVYMSKLLTNDDFNENRAYFTGIFCLGPGRDDRLYVHDYKIDPLTPDVLKKLFIPGKKQLLEVITASDLEGS